MIVVREPVLHPVAITDLRPTQISVGLREVKEKRGRLRNHPQKKIGKFLGDHMIPVVRGPRDRSMSSTIIILRWRCITRAFVTSWLVSWRI